MNEISIGMSVKVIGQKNSPVFTVTSDSNSNNKVNLVTYDANGTSHLCRMHKDALEVLHFGSPPIQLGHKVGIRSGGRAMTVTGISEDGDRVCCSWWEGGQYRSTTFPLAGLVLREG